MIDASAAAVVQSAATTIVAGAATYVAHKIGRLVQTIEDNEERSVDNREILVGTDHREGVVDHLDGFGPEED